VIEALSNEMHIDTTMDSGGSSIITHRDEVYTWLEKQVRLSNNPAPPHEPTANPVAARARLHRHVLSTQDTSSSHQSRLLR
jgi:hypothetical protein